MKNLKKFVLLPIFLCSIIIFPSNTHIHAAGGGDDFSIIKKAENAGDLKTKTETIGKTPGKVMENYKEIANGMSAEDQLASGIMNRNTIYNYLIFFVQYLSQLGLIVGVLFIIYAGYKYMTSVFTGKSAPTDVLSNAIIGVLIVIFSYAITKLLTGFIGLS